MRHLPSLLIASALSIGGTEARAQPPGDPPRRVDYGWQNAVVGYAGLGLVVHGFFSDSNALMLTGAATWALGGSFVHAAHGHPSAAAATPFVTAGITFAILGLGAVADAAPALALGGLYALVAPVVDGAIGGAHGGDAPVFTRVGLGVARFRSRHPAAGDGVLGATTQFGATLELSVGAHIGQIVVAGTLLEHIVAFDRARDYAPTAPATGDFSFTLATIGPTVEWHPQRRGGPFVGGTVGVAHFARNTNDAPVGAAIALNGGYEFSVSPRSSIGVALRVLYASMRTTDYGGSHVQAFTPSLMLAYSYR